MTLNKINQLNEFTPLRKLLKDKVQLNPFNDKFQKDKYLEIIRSSITNEDIKQDNLLETLELLPFLNQNFKEYYNYLKENVLSANISFENLIDLLFAVLNRNFLVATKKILKDSEGKTEINQKEAFSYKIETPDKSIGKIEISSILESDIDALNYIVNYIRYFEDKKIKIDQSKRELHPIEISKKIALSSNFFNTIKSLYDESIWNMGYWKIDNTQSKLKFTVVFEDKEMLILNKVGLTRLQKNISSNYFIAKNEVSKESLYGNYIFKHLKLRLKEKRVKSVSINNGIIYYRLAKGFGKKEIETELKNHTAFTTYYNFLENIVLESLEKLTLTDLIKLFSLLQDLIDNIIEIKFDDSIHSLNDLKKFPIKIERLNLIKYFLERSEFSKKQISKFIDLISFNFGERINLWDRPFVLYNDFYYINYLSITSPVIINLIDNWIEKAGISLDVRGKYLERYLQKKLESILTQRRMFKVVLERNKLFNKARKFEELDLVVILKSIIVVAEVKCIKFPFDARDKHNSLNRLKQGVKQIKRKKDFIDNYKHEIDEIKEFIQNKKIIPIIITNLPLFTGYVIDGVSITDYYLFESYFMSGKATDGKIYKGGATEVVREFFYYKNEDEMNYNFSNFFSNPYPVQEIKKLYEIVEQKITLENFNYDLYATSAQIRDDYLSI